MTKQEIIDRIERQGSCHGITCSGLGGENAGTACPYKTLANSEKCYKARTGLRNPPIAIWAEKSNTEGECLRIGLLFKQTKHKLDCMRRFEQKFKQGKERLK